MHDPFSTIASRVKDMPPAFYTAMSQASANYSQAMSHEQTHLTNDALAQRTPTRPMDLASHALDVMSAHADTQDWLKNWSVNL